MRIDLTRRRRGSLALEAIMVIPFALTVILAARYITEGMLTRQQVAVYTRDSTIKAANSRLPYILSCKGNRDAIGEKSGIDETASADCNNKNAETGLPTGDRFFSDIRDGARAYPRMIRDVHPRSADRVYDVKGDGEGSFLMSDPAFLQKEGAVVSAQTFRAPKPVFFDHAKAPYVNGHDRALWQELSRKNTRRLFPNVFPARSR